MIFSFFFYSIISGFDLTEFGLSTEPHHSELTAIGIFLTGEVINRVEKLIRFSVPL